jgi:histone acetyltransferase SAS3
MAVAVLMETELQNSLATSEEDAEYEEDEELAAQIMESTDMYASNQLKNGLAEAQNEHEGSWGDNEREVDEDVLSDEPAEGEEDEEMPDPDSNADEDDEDGEDGDEEGVGAVKIQPGIDDDEDVVSGSEEEEESAVSVEDDESKDSTDAEVEERWEPAAEEEDDLANPNRCMCVYFHPDLMSLTLLQILSSRRRE